MAVGLAAMLTIVLFQLIPVLWKLISVSICYHQQFRAGGQL